MPAENMSRRAALGLASSVAAAAALPLRGARAATSPWTGEGFVSCPGMQIHYAILGEGPPLVLLHKLGGWIADWRHVAPALARHHRVIAFDSPGHGDSVVQGKVPYLLSLPESAAILLSVLDELGIERFSLVGNSLGGCIGVCMAALWPARIERLGLLSVALYPVIPRAALDGLEPAGTWGRMTRLSHDPSPNSRSVLA